MDTVILKLIWAEVPRCLLQSISKMDNQQGPPLEHRELCSVRAAWMGGEFGREWIHGNVRLMLCYAKSLQSCPTLRDPIDGSHQAPPSLGFSRQEHWSGLPFPSPVHESEKWKRSRSVVSDSVIPWSASHQAPLSMGFSRQEYWSGGAIAFSNVRLNPVAIHLRLSQHCLWVGYIPIQNLKKILKCG